jgi:hypothetical protein
MRELVVFLLSYHPQLAAGCIYVLLNIDLLFVVSEFLRLRQMSKSVKKQITLIPALRGLSQNRNLFYFTCFTLRCPFEISMERKNGEEARI